MCLIAICVDQKMTLEAIRRAFFENDDGASITWMNDKRKVEYIKGISSVEEIYNLSLATELPFVIHFRKTSTGLKTDPLLTHPFEISKESPLKLYGETERVLIHNGTEVDWRKCLAASGLSIPKDKDGKPQDMSDTRAIAMILSQHKNNNFLHSATGKFVVIGHNSVTDEQAFRYYGDFSEEDGILYSNLIWKWSKTYGWYDGKNYNNLENYDVGHGQHHQSSKKKDEEKTSPEVEYPILRQPYSFSAKTERYKYLRWWKSESNADGLKLDYSKYSLKYPKPLPPNSLAHNTVNYKLIPPIIPPVLKNKTQAEEEKEFFSGSSQYNRGDFF
jgi:hypothetical protein